MAAAGTAAVMEAAVSAAVAVADVTAEPNAELSPIATAVGEAWAAELVRTLRANEREIIGSWPGTMREARMRVLARLHRQLDLSLLDELARLVTVAARREWHQVSQPDPEQ
jgi:hypothetical protein